MFIHIINTDTESISLYLLSVTDKMIDAIQSPVKSLLLHLKSPAENRHRASHTYVADWNRDTITLLSHLNLKNYYSSKTLSKAKVKLFLCLIN
jgi:hypothetical protein